MTFFISIKQRGRYSVLEIRPYVKWSPLTKGWNNEELLNWPQKCSRLLTRGWSFTRDSNYGVLLEKILVFWIDRRMWEMAAYMRWSHIEVQLSALVWACLGFSAISEMRWQKLFYFKFHSYFETYGLKIHRIFQKQSILWKLLLVCALRPSVDKKNSYRYTILLGHNQTNC